MFSVIRFPIFGTYADELIHINGRIHRINLDGLAWLAD